MNNTIRYLLSGLLTLTVASLSLAGEENESQPQSRALFITKDTEGKTITKEIELEGSHEMHAEKKIVTFLGVQTDQASPALRAQLGLPADTGLVVAGVVPESAAVTVLRPYDILLKFDDQILVSSEQLAILVRNHEKGDEVELTFLRAGKEATASVALGEREIRLKRKVGFKDKESGPLIEWREKSEGHFAHGNQGTDRFLSILEMSNGKQPRRVIATEDRGDQVVRISIHADDGTMEFNDDEGSLTLTTRDGSKELVATDSEGKELFSGPINTPEERAQLSPALRKRLDKIEGMQQFEFHTDEDFKGMERKSITPLKQGASLRAPAKKTGLRRLDTY